MANTYVRRLYQKSYSVIRLCNKLSTTSFIRNVPPSIYDNQNCSERYQHFNSKLKFPKHSSRLALLRHYTDEKKDSLRDTDETAKKKLSLFQRFKMMYRDYWYVLVPVHLVTSAAWFGGFYYVAKSGVDVVAFLEMMHISDKIINPLRDSSLGYIALAYALYKIATPLRYTVTLGGTTVTIKYLKEWGYIKPVPSREQLKEIYKEKKDNLKDRRDAFVNNIENSIKKLKKSTEDIKEKNK